MKQLLILLILINCSCARNDATTFEDGEVSIDITSIYTNSLFEPYIASIETGLTYTSYSNIRFLKTGETLQRNQVAICITEYKLVIVRPEAWATMSSTSREILIIHELGHCDFRMLHSDDPDDIMFTHITNRQKLLFELSPTQHVEDMFENANYF